MSGWGGRKAVIIHITKIIVMKPHRITRRVLLRTSLFATCVAIIVFALVYFVVLFMDNNRKRLDLWRRSKFANGMSQNGRQLSEIILGFGDYGQSQVVKNLPVIWDPELLNIHKPQLPQCVRNVVLLLLIISSPYNAEKRMHIRKTWCSDTSYQYHCVFLIGQIASKTITLDLRLESQQHKDILFGNYEDTYRNLTLKVLHGLYWSLQFCSSYQYVLKTDDDCFVNTRLVVDFLSSHNKQTEKLYVGNIYRMGQKNLVIRNPASQWFVSYHDYNDYKYPPYASGEGYILSKDLIQPIIDFASRHMKPFPNEDAYIGVVMKHLKVDPIHSHRFTLVNVRWSVCNFMYIMVVHNIDPQRQDLLYQTSRQAFSQCMNMRKVVEW